MTISVYIATSIDGYIAERDGGIDFLETVPTPEGDDLGYGDFMADIDAVVMGRGTFETVVGFDIGWPYPVPGIVLSSTLKKLPEGFPAHVTLASGKPQKIVALAAAQNWFNLYIDGGVTIQRFLKEDLIDRLILTEIPILLGDGVPLFGEHNNHLVFELEKVETTGGPLAKRFYRRSERKEP